MVLAFNNEDQSFNLGCHGFIFHPITTIFLKMIKVILNRKNLIKRNTHYNQMNNKLQNFLIKKQINYKISYQIKSFIVKKIIIM